VCMYVCLSCKQQNIVFLTKDDNNFQRMYFIIYKKFMVLGVYLYSSRSRGSKLAERFICFGRILMSVYTAFSECLTVWIPIGSNIHTIISIMITIITTIIIIIINSIQCWVIIAHKFWFLPKRMHEFVGGFWVWWLLSRCWSGHSSVTICFYTV
jgi:hypothetical protein